MTATSVYLTRPDVLLRLESIVFLVIGCVAYQHLYPGHWGLFALLFLVPDVSLLGYARSAAVRKGPAAFYNAVHSYVLPLALGLFAWKQEIPLAGEAALVWLSHISFDRALGFGLKFPEDFRYTHIQSCASFRNRVLQYYGGSSGLA